MRSMTKVAREGTTAKAGTREERLAAQLRANLARRKQQAREKARLEAQAIPSATAVTPRIQD